MGVKEAAAKRIKALCKERNITITALARLSAVPPSTIYSLFDKSRKDVGILLLKKICDGLDIDFITFFDDPLFKNLEQEIK